MKATPEIRLTLAVMRERGVKFYPTEKKTLVCGCCFTVGWWTEKAEQGIVAAHCSPEHRPHVAWVVEHMHDDEVDLRFVNEPAVESCSTLLSERLGVPVVP